jgi:hypothetical protein
MGGIKKFDSRSVDE